MMTCSGLGERARCQQRRRRWRRRRQQQQRQWQQQQRRWAAAAAQSRSSTAGAGAASTHWSQRGLSKKRTMSSCLQPNGMPTIFTASSLLLLQAAATGAAAGSGDAALSPAARSGDRERERASRGEFSRLAMLCLQSERSESHWSAVRAGEATTAALLRCTRPGTAQCSAFAAIGAARAPLLSSCHPAGGGASRAAAGGGGRRRIDPPAPVPRRSTRPSPGGRWQGRKKRS